MCSSLFPSEKVTCAVTDSLVIATEVGYCCHLICAVLAFSAENRQIVSGSRDKTIKLWNTLAECKYTIQDVGHTDWVSCVRFSPNHSNLIIVSCGWDWNLRRGASIKIWDLTCKNTVEELRPEVVSSTSKANPPQCLSLAWSTDGQTLFAGYSVPCSLAIRVWQVSISAR